MKKTFKLLALLLMATFLVACGTEKKEENYGSVNENAADIKAEIEAEKDKAEAEANKKDKEINPQSETELEVNLAGTKVKLCQTLEEFQKLVSDNNWKYVDENLVPENHTGFVTVTTNVGDIRFYFMPNKDNNGSELYKINISPADINYSADVDVCGVNVFTPQEKIKEKLEVIRENEYSFKYLLHENVTLETDLLKDDPLCYIITIERTQYNKR